MTKHNAYPTKTTLNLMIRERRQGDMRILIPCALVGVILLVLFCNYAVVGRLAKAYRAEQAALQAEQELDRAQTELENYDKVEAEYHRYFSDALFSSDIPQECMDVLAMMEKELMGKVRVSSFTFSGKTLLLQLKMSRLGVTSELLEALNSVPMVDYVSISTAADDLIDPAANNVTDSENSIVIMTITLREAEEK